MSNFQMSREPTRFDPTALLDLFVLDGTSIGMSTVFYFYDGTSTQFQPLTFNGQEYAPFPIKLTDFGYDGKGGQVRPKLTASNINGFTSNLLLQYGQLVGATIIHRRVFARFIDAVNWPGNVSPYTPDPTAAYPDQIWSVNRKITENPQIVQWELSSPIDMQNVKLPRRQIIANVCAAPWKYRDQRTCGYDGLPVADVKNRPFGAAGYGYTVVDRGLFSASTTYNQGDACFVYSSLPQFTGIKIYYVCNTNGTVVSSPVGSSSFIADQCSKSCAACKLRFTDTPLRGAFYPGVTRAPWILT
jgi:lambda family phage minor tail protein L